MPELGSMAELSKLDQPGSNYMVFLYLQHGEYICEDRGKLLGGRTLS